MRRVFIVQLIAAVLIFSAVGDADARRRIRMPFIVDDSGGSIVKVVDLPDIPILKRKDRKYVDLGYRHFFDRRRRVGRLRRLQQPLSSPTPPMLKGLVVIGDLDKLPPPPKRSAASTAMGSIWWVLLGVGALAILWKAVGMVRGAVGTGARSAAKGMIAASSSSHHEAGQSSGMAAAALAMEAHIAAAHANTPPMASAMAGSSMPH